MNKNQISVEERHRWPSCIELAFRLTSLSSATSAETAASSAAIAEMDSWSVPTLKTTSEPCVCNVFHGTKNKDIILVTISSFYIILHCQCRYDWNKTPTLTSGTFSSIDLSTVRICGASPATMQARAEQSTTVQVLDMTIFVETALLWGQIRK